MTQTDIREDIRSALNGIPDEDFEVAAKRLLEVLGYHSERTQELSGCVDDFIREFPAPNQYTKTEEEFRKLTESVKLIFQVTSDEIASSTQPTITFDPASFDKGQHQSFMFFAVELKEETYARGEYAQFTREINKRLSQPTVVLFGTADHRLTLSFVHRREHKRDRNRDVLGKVSLIREIVTADPHRAHLDILTELSLAECTAWMDLHNKPHNFDSLLAGWLDKLDTEELNRQFYRELFDWFERAVEDARFPKTVPGEQQVIRLITRILFVWFIKEKGLVQKEWFEKAKVEQLLNNFGGSDYYRAVLQNLFFATLNTEMDSRGFSTRREPSHRVFSRYRYKSLIRDLERFEGLMKQTPFINGGLFDCLDDEESRSAGGKRIDMFSDPDPKDGPRAVQARRDAWRQLNVPDALFFDDEDGLFPLLNHYKFTVEENTPIEQEVALDPELLGKVFENLLAAYNPETRDTVRKQTGSYYTPRVVVDYMVDEALVATLKQGVKPADGDLEFLEERLQYLLDYEDAFDDANELFEKVEVAGIVQAISEIKVLDPAVGSGAFPMGVLHKLTLALRRLDPDNKHWEELQKKQAIRRAATAFDTRDRNERREELEEISQTFDRYRDSDFGRKLYLIQNSIYGVDIQPVACQIAKLRFFISLAIDQLVDNKADNFGIKPLPNLETRFVAANTLLSLDKPDQMSLGQTTEVRRLEQKLNENRERHFHATLRSQKLKYQLEDARLRTVLATKLQKSLTPTAADQVAKWDPYDQNAAADWFDPEYMLGIADGFDVVIGNPPYIQLQKNGGKLGKLYKDTGYATFARTGDIYLLFCEKGCQLLKSAQGLLTYITSNSWLKAEYGKALRRYLAERHTPLRLLEMGKDVFENTIVDASVLFIREGKGIGREAFAAVDMDRMPTNDFPPEECLWGQTRPDGEKPWSILSRTEQNVMEKMQARGTPLKDWDVSIYRGILTGFNDAFIIDNDTK
ncbi:MAG: Eco57I restriction-modification methylase domain-containing protein, partial [Gemmatimonadota bacterium]|nr:Eco57I restriction-modification methylase domain-containing protein [Gemmatimonadota bacterium]